ncbi:hypothetical protein ZWY2020_009438 [Hordeum vulgare]|nr:hypothetical protein ZWY2020_009438 [Hordeum vulgare]
MHIYFPWDLDVYGTIGGPRRSDTEENQEIPSDILQEILLKLPTEDTTRCRRVSRQWRSALEDLSFRKLHAESPAALSAEPQLLRLSSKPHNFSQSITTVHNVSTRKPMCSIDMARPLRPHQRLQRPPLLPGRARRRSGAGGGAQPRHRRGAGAP